MVYHQNTQSNTQQGNLVASTCSFLKKKFIKAQTGQQYVNVIRIMFMRKNVWIGKHLGQVKLYNRKMFRTRKCSGQEMFGTGVQQNLLNIWKGNGRTAENKPYLFQCSLTNAVVFNAQAFTAFFQGTKDVRPAQLLIIYLVMEQALQRENTPPIFLF